MHNALAINDVLYYDRSINLFLFLVYQYMIFELIFMPVLLLVYINKFNIMAKRDG